MSISYSRDCTYLYDTAAVEAQQELRRHVERTTHAVWGDRSGQPLCLIKQGGEEIIGCACGIVTLGWLHLELLWVEPAHRNRNIGTELMQKIEDKAAEMGAHSVYLWTQEFEAPEFYRRLGYREFATLPEFGVGHQLIGMRKRLLPAQG